MKRVVIFFAWALMFLSPVAAQLKGDGYYRVQNVRTERYVLVLDDKGSIDLASTRADLGAMLTLKYFSNVVSNPASVIYVKKVGSSYNLVSQGTDAHAIIGYYLDVQDMGNGIYRAYKSRSGTTIYLSDEDTDEDDGVMMTSGAKTRNWYVKPIAPSGDNYFAVTPEMAHEGRHFATLYASFPYRLLGDGMKAYYIQLVDQDKAVFAEVEDGVVPAAVPVIIQCGSASYENNKVDILTTSPAALSGNQLRGVYFNNGKKPHVNRVSYDAATMRVLGLTSDGSLGFITANLDYLPANRAYLTVPQDSPAEIKLVSMEEYMDGIRYVPREGRAGRPGVYTISGVKISDDSQSLQGLPAGVYVVNGRKVALP